MNKISHIYPIKFFDIYLNTYLKYKYLYLKYYYSNGSGPYTIDHGVKQKKKLHLRSLSHAYYFDHSVVVIKLIFIKTAKISQNFASTEGPTDGLIVNHGGRKCEIVWTI